MRLVSAAGRAGGELAEDGTHVQRELIPKELLFGHPERTMPGLSPDGTRLSFLAPSDGVLNLWVSSLDLLESRPVTRDRRAGVLYGSFAHDEQHLIYLQDRDGDENWHLHLVDTESGRTRDLTPFDGVQARVVHNSRRHQGQMLVALNKDDKALHDVYWLEPATGELRLVERHPGPDSGLSSWLADEDLAIRASVWSMPDGTMQVRVRDEPGGPWRTLTSFDLTDSMTSHPCSFSADGKRLLVRSSQGARTRRLAWVDLATGAVDVVAEDPRYDVAWVIQDPERCVPQVAAFLSERIDYQVLDPTVAEDVARVRAAHHGDFALVSRDKADRTWIVGYMADNIPATTALGAYHLYDRLTGQSVPLFSERTALAGYQLARTEPFSFESRDGLIIRGYLTFPPHLPRRQLPTVVLVHGGPWARDTWTWSPDVQLLANRGYLVAQVNFRGSIGYGSEFINAGNHEWGGKMHDDVIDAVRWLTAGGAAAEDRVAIAGSSFGGYEALIGAAFTPDVFRCAVSCCGPVNLSTMIRTTPAYWIGFNRQLRARVGDPDVDADFLWSRSPLSRVADIRIPILVIQGANDARVKLTESEQLVSALRAHGLPYRYLLFEDEGHVIRQPKNVLKMWQAIEEFLAEHLGGDREE